jgi:hypothetical protein
VLALGNGVLAAGYENSSIRLQRAPARRPTSFKANQHVVQLGFPSMQRSIAGFSESIFREALGHQSKT